MNNKKILMVVYSYFPQDARVRREAEALVNAGYNIDMICLKRQEQIKKEKTNGVNAYRINIKKSRSTKSKYITQYAVFFILSFFKINMLFLKKKYNGIHVHNMPDFLVFLAVIPKLFGTKVFLDLHDPSPEILMTKFDETQKSRLTRLLEWQEKVSIKFANIVITTNKAFVDTFVSRGCPPDKIKIVMNTPQESIFNKFTSDSNENLNPKKFILMYHGLIVERHGLDTAVDAVNLLKDRIPGLEFIVFGNGEFVPVFTEKVAQLKLENKIKYFGAVPIYKIAETIPQCNIGIIPNKLGSFTQINFPTRIFEYLCMKKPVVVPHTQGIKDYFDEDSIFYFDAGNTESLAEVILNIYSNPERTMEVVDRGYNIYQKFTWEKQSKELLKIYEETLD